MSLHDIPKTTGLRSDKTVYRQLEQRLDLLISGDYHYANTLEDELISLKADFQYLNDARCNAEELAAERLEKIHWLQESANNAEIGWSQAKTKIGMLQVALDAAQAFQAKENDH